MKKIAFFFFLFLFLHLTVWASDLKLEDLSIKNGTLSIPFDPLNNEYTISLEKEEYHVEFDYKVEEGIAVFIKDNHDLENNSLVILSLTDEKNVVEYHFQILKEEEETTTDVFLSEEPIPIKFSFMYEYKIYIIPSVCLLCLFIVFKLLFHKKKNPHRK